MPTWRTVSGTGHRPEGLRVKSEQWARYHAARVLERLRRSYGTEIVISGMARGWDMWLAYEAILSGLLVEPHIPFPQQPDGRGWTALDRERYRWLLDHAGLEPVFYGDSYDVRLFHARNAGMGDRSDAVMALYDGRRDGGTFQALKQLPVTVPVIRLDPLARTVVWPQVFIEQPPLF